MDFGANKTPTEVIKEGTFGDTYFRDIYSGVTGKWYKISWKEFNQLKDIDQKYYCTDYYDVSVNKYVVTCGILLRFREDKVALMKIRSWVEDRKMMKGKLIDRKELLTGLKLK